MNTGSATPSTAEAQAEPESKITLRLLDAVEADGTRSQRSLARELGIALGLTNAYLRRCIRKGLIKVSQAPANRYAYYLTPKGFAEKSRLTAEYLTSALQFYRRARSEMDALLAAVAARGMRRLALVGRSDLAEIAFICSLSHGLTIVCVVDPKSESPLLGVPSVRELEQVPDVDGYIITDLTTPQASFDHVAARVPLDQIAAPALLRISMVF